jgi:hypothetical protein
LDFELLALLLLDLLAGFFLLVLVLLELAFAIEVSS